MIYNIMGRVLSVMLAAALTVGCSCDDGSDNSSPEQDAGQDGATTDTSEDGEIADADEDSALGDAGEVDMIEASSRDSDPVVLAGDDLGLLIGRAPSKLVAYRYLNGWQRVPIQVDERVTVDLATVYGFDGLRTRCVVPELTLATCYADPKTFTGADTDPLIDADDEVVFMYRDSARRPRDFREPIGVINGSGIEVALSDTATDQEPRYLYLFANDGSLEPEAEDRYGQYDFQLVNGDYPMDYDFCNGPNPEDSWFESDTYKRHFTDRWLSDVMEILGPGASGVDILDAQFVTKSGTEVCGTGSGDGFAKAEGAIITTKNGPVRSIYSFIGSESAPFSQRTHLFYQKREDIVHRLRVHSMGAGIQEGFKYSSEAVGMKYYDADNRQGLTIDRVPDDFKSQSIGSANVSYEKMCSLITGPQGSLAMVGKIDTDIADFTFQGLYRDDDPEADTQCDQDESYYGITGAILADLPCLESFCENYLESVRTFYYSGPGMTLDDAIALAKNIYTPIQIELTAEGKYQDQTDAADGGQTESDAAEASLVDPDRVLCDAVTSIDEQADGQDDSRWTASVDQGGNRVVEQWDKNADGDADALWTVLYQDRDTVVTEQWDDGADGDIEALRINTFDCHPTIELIFMRWTCDLIKSETDSDADGVMDEVWLFEYQDDNLVEEKWDKDGDGVVDQRWEAEWESDESGRHPRLVRISWDSDGDDRIDQIMVQEFDDDGELSRQQWDTNGDGEADESIQYTYDEEGYIPVSIARYRGETKIAEERKGVSNDQPEWGSTVDWIEWDQDGDGVAETTLTYRREDWEETLFEDGSMSVGWNTIVQEWAYGEDAVVDEIITNSNGKHLWDRDADGTDDAFCEYDQGENREIPIQCDTDGDEQIDWQVNRTDSENCTVRIRSQFDLDFYNIDIDNYKDMKLSPGLAQERAYRSEFSQVFEDAEAVGVYRPEAFCSYCY